MTTTSRKILIIGGVAGGATAAARARRADEFADITVLEKGSSVSFANCGLPYYISGHITQRAKLLLQTPEGFYDRYRIRVLTNTEALQVDRARRLVLARTPSGVQEFYYDKLILSQGGHPILPELPGMDTIPWFTLRSMEDVDDIFTAIQDARGRNAVIVGGGFIGLEMAEAFVARGLHTSIVERLPRLMANLDPEFSAMAESAMVQGGVQVFCSNAIQAIEKGHALLEGGQKLPCDLILFAAGVRPETGLAISMGLELGKTGGVLVNENQVTSDPDVYAVGDMAEVIHRVSGRKVRMPLAGPANRQGRIAASHACGLPASYKGVLGTAIVKLFQYTLASTGLTEAAAKDAAFDAGSVVLNANDHAGYYPGAKPIVLKVIYEAGSGRVLGAQCFGEAGVDKRIDILATAITGGLTLEELEQLDLCYAPPYSSANDLVNVIGYAGMNRKTGFSPSLSPDEFVDFFSAGDAFILDVRDVSEFERGHIPSAVNIPVNALRDRLHELPKDKDILLYCQVGRRGHVALRILKQRGFERVFNVQGGFQSLELRNLHKR